MKLTHLRVAPGRTGDPDFYILGYHDRLEYEVSNHLDRASANLALAKLLVNDPVRAISKEHRDLWDIVGTVESVTDTTTLVRFGSVHVAVRTREFSDHFRPIN